jgi:RNA polymerase sigma-70 factor (ECF subfamily)
MVVDTEFTMGDLASTLVLANEESSLIAELRAGSEEAFAWLITHYHQPIYSLLARTLNDRDVAADLTQEVFIKVFRGIGGFHGESSLRTWIYRIALREASNQRRWWMRHRQQEMSLDQEMGETDAGCESRFRYRDLLIDPQDSPLELMMQDEVKERVVAALGQVAEPFRTTLILREIEGFGYEEMAEIEGVNLGTVKSRLVRGRAMLKKQLMATMEVKTSTETSGERFPAPVFEEAQ